jgi:hypothetical protein
MDSMDIDMDLLEEEVVLLLEQVLDMVGIDKVVADKLRGILLNIHILRNFHSRHMIRNVVLQILLACRPSQLIMQECISYLRKIV